MTTRTKRARFRPAVLAAAIAALALAGCSTGHIGESWQCPLAEGGACDSVAAADPAVPDAAGGAVLGEPLWRVRSSDRSQAPPARGEPAPASEPGGQAVETPCDSGCGTGFDPFAWLARLFGGADGADRPAMEDPNPAMADPSPEGASSGSAVGEVDAVAPSPAPAQKKSPPVEPAAAGLPDTSEAADDDKSGADLRTGEVVARIWIAPFVDANGVYREASHVRVVLEPAGWRLK